MYFAFAFRFISFNHAGSSNLFDGKYNTQFAANIFSSLSLSPLSILVIR